MARSRFQFCNGNHRSRDGLCMATSLMSGAVRSGRRHRADSRRNGAPFEKPGQFVEVFSLGGLVKRYLSVAWDVLAIHASKWLQRDPGELVVHLGNSLRLRDECRVTRFRIFGADFDGFLERFAFASFSKNAAPSLKDLLA